MMYAAKVLFKKLGILISPGPKLLTIIVAKARLPMSFLNFIRNEKVL